MTTQPGWITVSLEVLMTEVQERQLRAALDTLSGRFGIHLGDVLVAAIAIAQSELPPGPSEVEMTPLQRLMRDIPSDVWDLWLPTDAIHRVVAVPAAVSAARDE